MPGDGPPINPPPPPASSSSNPLLPPDEDAIAATYRAALLELKGRLAGTTFAFRDLAGKAPVFADPPPAGAPPGFAAAATHPLASFLATPPIPADLLPYLAPPAGGEGARVGGRRRKQ